MEHVTEDFLFVEKYRPKKVQEAVLPAGLKKTFQQFIDQQNVPNLLLTGPAGCGKTTVARAMLEELGCDYIVINGSMNGNIDTLRNDILSFASSVSLTGGRKYVILDEADYLNPQSTQPALRNFMEEFSRNCGFILTCNFPSKIIEPLRSRCAVIDFKIPPAEADRLAASFFKRALAILKAEGIEHDPAAVAAVVNHFFPDWRRVLNELQRYSAQGKIDTGILAQMSDSSFLELVEMLKAKQFTQMRSWVGENSPDATSLFRKFYDTAVDHVAPSSIPELVLLISKYSYQSAFVADQEVNTAAFLTEVMAGVAWK
jgi:DNA polymerase III delta prime subunit